MQYLSVCDHAASGQLRKQLSGVPAAAARLRAAVSPLTGIHPLQRPAVGAGGAQLNTKSVPLYDAPLPCTGNGALCLVPLGVGIPPVLLVVMILPKGPPVIGQKSLLCLINWKNMLA